MTYENDAIEISTKFEFTIEDVKLIAAAIEMLHSNIQGVAYALEDERLDSILDSIKDLGDRWDRYVDLIEQTLAADGKTPTYQ